MSTSLIDHLDYCLQEGRGPLNETASTNETNSEGATSKSAVEGKCCFLCNKLFATQFTLNRHLSKQHQLQVNYANRVLQCPIQQCSQTFSFIHNLRSHLINVHQISIRDCQILNFSTFDCFMKWKSKEESQTRTRFIRPYGKYERVADGVEVHQFQCHRSGAYSPAGKGKRTLKSQGTIKMGSTCPATITAYFSKITNTVQVKYYSTHVGHIAEKVFFNYQERQEVKRMLKTDVTFKLVLDHIQSWFKDEQDEGSASEELKLKIEGYMAELELIDSIKQDKSLRPSGSVHATDQTNNFVDEILDCQLDNPVICSRLGFNSTENSMVIVMTKLQEDFMKLYGNDGLICITTTANLEIQQYFTIIYVARDARNIFPCLYVLSDKLDIEVWTEIFETVKSKCGIIKPKIMLSDNSDMLETVWANVMEVHIEKHLLNSWAVDLDWRTNLCKIIGKQHQKAEMYKSLTVLLLERDLLKHSVILSSLTTCLQSKYFENFGTYLKSHWLTRIKLWAFAFRDSITSAVDLEIHKINQQYVNLFNHLSVHQISNDTSNRRINEKTSALGGKFDNILKVLLRICRDNGIKSYLTFNSSYKLWLSALVTTNHHHQCCVFSFNHHVITTCSNGWLIESCEGDFIVFQKKEKCDYGDGCILKCVSCHICIHCFSCSCAVSLLHPTICQHVHLIARTIKQSVTKSDVETSLISSVEYERTDFNDLLEMEDKSGIDCNITVEIMSLAQQIALKVKDVNDISTLQCVRDNLKYVLCVANNINPS
ncbi:hypothetical protein CHUAL_014162 [Chamberlinius hualienensis]